MYPSDFSLYGKSPHVFVTGKGRKDRVVPIHPELLRKLIHFESTRSSHHLFFCMSDSVLRRLKARVQEQLPFRFTLHMLRHTFATRALESGAGIKAISDILGHSDLKTTMIYAKATPNYNRDQIIKLKF